MKPYSTVYNLAVIILFVNVSSTKMIQKRVS